MSDKRPRITAGKVLQSRAFVLRVGSRAGMEVEIGPELYFVESAYSYPGVKIGHNFLSQGRFQGEASWNPRVRKAGPGVIEIEASGEFYTLLRKIEVQHDRIEVSDTLSNTTREDVGIIIRNAVIASGRSTGSLLCGVPSSAAAAPENPTVLLQQKQTGLGAAAEDSISRLQFQASAVRSEAAFTVGHLGLAPAKSVTLEWALYPLSQGEDYWAFVNRIRKHWKTNFPILGPFDFFGTRDSILEDTDRLQAYLKRKHLKIVALRPWLFYFDGAPLSRTEHKALWQKARAALKKADPQIKCIGCIENNIVSLDRAKVPQSQRFNDVCLESGRYPIALSAEQTRILEECSPWKDSLIKNPAGRAMIEDCFPKTFIHQIVYSEPGNYQADYLMEQVKFAIDEVGLDGVYIDQFSHAWGSRPFQYHYGKWDGITVDVDPKTGKISRKYTDAGLVGAKVREGLCRYVLSKGKVFVANTHAAVRQTQALPVFRFMEGGGSARGATWKEGRKPPLLPYLCRGHLDSPISLGVPSAKSAEATMKGVIVFLRHGLLYYHYDTAIPESGPGSGEYGPINHMFPITPVRLFEGGIEGRERTITCISGTYEWKHQQEPEVLLFGLDGRQKPHAIEPVKTETGWKVAVQLRDWQEIAVIE